MRLRASTAIRAQAAVCAGGAVAWMRLGAFAGRARSVPRVDTGAIDISAGSSDHSDAAAAADLAALTYELLDAHADTVQLADGLPYDQSWGAHLDYLRALQRAGREALARAAAEEVSYRRRSGLGSPDVR